MPCVNPLKAYEADTGSLEEEDEGDALTVPINVDKLELVPYWNLIVLAVPFGSTVPFMVPAVSETPDAGSVVAATSKVVVPGV